MAGHSDSKTMIRCGLVCLVWIGAGLTLFAHEARPAYLQLRQTSADRFDLLWKVPAQGDNLRLGLYVQLPESAEQLTDLHGMFVGGAYVERWTFREPNALIGSTIQIDGLRHTLTDVLVRIERLDGTTQVARLMPESPSLLVTAAPSGWQVTNTYFWIGVEHILLGVDHLLFVLGLLLLVDSSGVGLRLLDYWPWLGISGPTCSSGDSLPLGSGGYGGRGRGNFVSFLICE